MRAAAFAAASAALVLLCLLTGLLLSSRETPQLVVAAHLALFLAGVLVWLTALQWGAPRLGLLILAVAVTARLALLPFPPSDDVNRYLWEGRLVLAGDSPYAQTADEAPASWRDEVWAGMNNRHVLTAYPPLAQLVFAAAVAVDDDAWPLKPLFVLAELGALVVLAGELRRRSLPAANLALAAFSPVLLLGTAGEGHFDAVFVLAVLLAVRARSRDRDAWAWLWLAAAIQIKVVAVLLVPLFLSRGGWRSAWAALPALVLPTLPFVADLPNLMRGIAGFGVFGAHNGFVPAILSSALGDAPLAALVAYGLLAAWTALVTVRVDDPWRAAFCLFGALIVLSPSVHVWYLIWVVPFLAILPQPAWLLLSALQGLYYLVWATKAASGVWALPSWAWWATWLPFALLLAATSPSALRRLMVPRPPLPAAGPPAAVTAIVPVYGEADRIAACVEALQQQHPPPGEIIVVDGGSPDETAARARARGARVLAAPRGRGRQIAAAVAVTQGDVLWIVHADATPAAGTTAAILGALAAEPAAAGGAVGQRFARLTPLLAVVEALNALRSALFGISFGDQGQFVRRSALPRLGGFPDLPLMEDVELALRLRRAGPVLHLGRNGVVCTRRWDRSVPLARAWTVVRLTGSYLVSLRRRALAEKLFRIYYPADGA
jgi:hypothetical protein